MCNFRTTILEEAIHVKFNDTVPDKEISKLDESIVDLRLKDGIRPLISTDQPVEADTSSQSLEQPQPEEVKEPTRGILRKSHPESKIIGDPRSKVQTITSLINQGHITLISKVKPKHIDDAMEDEHQVKAMHEELD